MSRLLGLSEEKKVTMNYLMSTWNDRGKNTAKDVFKVRL